MPVALLNKRVRNFPENGPKLLLENPANVRDALLLLHEPAVDDILLARASICPECFCISWRRRCSCSSLS
jgi:hypothetical protein